MNADERPARFRCLTSFPIPAAGTPMPGTVRAAWRTAIKTGRVPSTVAPAWIPAPEPGAAEPSGPDGPGPEPEPGPDPVVDELGTELTARQRAQLIAALNTARAAGHQDPELLALLHANTDPDRHPLKLWLHVLRNSDSWPAQIVLQVAA